MLPSTSPENPGPPQTPEAPPILRRFHYYLSLLEANNAMLLIIADLEDKAAGNRPFDLDSLRTSLSELRAHLLILGESLLELGGDRYRAFPERGGAILRQLELALPSSVPNTSEVLIVELGRVQELDPALIGAKNARLATLRWTLGLPVPDGFAVTSAAFRLFLEHCGVSRELDSLQALLQKESLEELLAAGAALRTRILASPLPSILEDALLRHHDLLVARTGRNGVALRSSALGEDSLLSFAGQYETYLNGTRADLLDRYRAVRASAFSPRVLTYLHRHELSVGQSAMAVGCYAMVEAWSSGVVYTRDPLDPEREVLVVTAAFGLGPSVVAGTVDADTYVLSRDEFEVLETRVAEKVRRLEPVATGGVAEEAVPDTQQRQAVLGPEVLRKLGGMALTVERHFGCPQDLEWAIDVRGALLVLQTRELRTLARPTKLPTIDPALAAVVLVEGATVASPGFAAGPVRRMLPGGILPSGAEGVIVLDHPILDRPDMLRRAAALILEHGSVASHFATLAREYRVPMLIGGRGLEHLVEGREVTVDAYRGQVHEGLHLASDCGRQAPSEKILSDEKVLLLRRLLRLVAPLHLINPNEEGFTIANCETLHDLTRFAHQRAVQEVFQTMNQNRDRESANLSLRTDLPLEVELLYLDRPLTKSRRRRSIGPEELDSVPMTALWGGIAREGWPSAVHPVGFRGLKSEVGRTKSGTKQARRFSEKSYAVLSRDFLFISLHMGYHFTSIEARCTQLETLNYIRLQYKDGGSTFERRARRIALLAEILRRQGYECTTKADFLDAALTVVPFEQCRNLLHVLGRLSILTKQLDMALSSDAVARRDRDDILRNLEVRA